MKMTPAYSQHDPDAGHTGQPSSCYLGAHYLTVYSTVKGTRRAPNALRQSEEMDLFFLGLTTGQRAVRIGEFYTIPA